MSLLCSHIYEVWLQSLLHSIMSYIQNFKSKCEINQVLHLAEISQKHFKLYKMSEGISWQVQINTLCLERFSFWRTDIEF